MTNIDSPEFCLSKADERCQLTPPDLEATRERLSKVPEGYTKTLVKALKWAFPDKFKSEEDAYMVFDAMKAVIANGLKNKDLVGLEGLGEFRVEPGPGVQQVVFTPERVLIDTVNE
ncbi:MAG: hypothetical protein K9K64_07430 [Desulfohalobiaceae bacterium]|nr:hypothetical protein [Desulfohalobiaceae bacterium]